MASAHEKTLMTQAMEPRFFKALCDPNRIAILTRLAECCEPCKVSQITECCSVDISVVSRHLAVLRDAGILEAHKRGKEVYYTVRFKELVQTLRDMADSIENCCHPSHGRPAHDKSKDIEDE